MNQDVEAILAASDSEGDDDLDTQGVSLEDILQEDDDTNNFVFQDGLASAAPSSPLSSLLPDLKVGLWQSNAEGKGGIPLSCSSGSHTSLPVAGNPTPPPRTSFLPEDSEAARMLQQILRESEEELSSETQGDNMRETSSLGRGLDGIGGGSGVDGMGRDRHGVELDKGVADREDPMHSIDVERIIESVELEDGAEGGGRPIAFTTSSFSSMSSESALSGRGQGADSAARRTTPPRWLAQKKALPSPSRGGEGHSREAGRTGASSVLTLGEERTRDPYAKNASHGCDGAGGRGVENSTDGGPEAREDGWEEGQIQGAYRSWKDGSGSSRAGRKRAKWEEGWGDGAVGMGAGVLEKAEAAEMRLLRGGNRDIVSPLQVKRRLRAPSSAPGGAGRAPGRAPGKGGGAGGVVRLEKLEAVSRQLARNETYGKHGPGVCTCFAGHPKFMAVGTSRGLILLFDHFQEIRHVLGNTGGADNLPPDGAVMSMDMCPQRPMGGGSSPSGVGSSSGGGGSLDLLLAGYGSGKIQLWDFMR
ncbi:unnamed protein product, partial [Discosporangium mesarthrocarpum]